MSKFDSLLAEHLYGLSLESQQDDEVGSVQELGWYGLFNQERAILWETNQGFVYAQDYDNDNALILAWAVVETEYRNFYAESDDSNGGQF